MPGGVPAHGLPPAGTGDAAGENGRTPRAVGSRRARRSWSGCGSGRRAPRPRRRGPFAPSDWRGCRGGRCSWISRCDSRCPSRPRQWPMRTAAGRSGMSNPPERRHSPVLLLDWQPSEGVDPWRENHHLVPRPAPRRGTLSTAPTAPTTVGHQPLADGVVAAGCRPASRGRPRRRHRAPCAHRGTTAGGHCAGSSGCASRAPSRSRRGARTAAGIRAPGCPPSRPFVDRRCLQAPGRATMCRASHRASRLAGRSVRSTRSAVSTRRGCRRCIAMPSQ